MNISIAKGIGAFREAAAWKIAAQMTSKPDSVIGLSTGRTTGEIHRMVTGIHDRLSFDTSRLTIFGLDEVTGVDKHYSGACWEMLWTEIVSGLGIGEDNFIMLPTESDDWDKACRDFTTELQARGGIDLLILGIGENAHLGFNQPGTSWNKETCLGYMCEDLESRIRRETGTPDDKHLGGVTLGIAGIMKARRIILLANGANKAEAVRNAIEGPVTADVPASVLQLHPDCEFILDEEAAGLLSNCHLT